MVEGDFDIRIAAALDRIRAGLDGMGAIGAAAPVGDGRDVQDLRAALDEERTASAQLQERVRLLKDRQDSRMHQLEQALADEQAARAALDGDLQALRESNADLRDLVAALRQAVSAGVSAPELVNRAAIAELESLRATRAADRAELAAVIAELEPLIGKAD
jgi:predicted  nucleic acid-binding Zn-ribbon protein